MSITGPDMLVLAVGNIASQQTHMDTSSGNIILCTYGNRDTSGDYYFVEGHGHGVAKVMDNNTYMLCIGYLHWDTLNNHFKLHQVSSLYSSQLFNPMSVRSACDATVDPSKLHFTQDIKTEINFVTPECVKHATVWCLKSPMALKGELMILLDLVNPHMINTPGMHAHYCSQKRR